MRLHTIVCAGIAAALLSLSPVDATAQTSPSRGFTNADFLRLPEREQRVWVSGAVEGLGFSLLMNNPEHGRCVLIWYGNGSTHFANIQRSARANPSEEPIYIVMALANRQCRFRPS